MRISFSNGSTLVNERKEKRFGKYVITTATKVDTIDGLT
jgi:hypothetical protein